jgi:hypothetical protein
MKNITQKNIKASIFSAIFIAFFALAIIASPSSAQAQIYQTGTNYYPSNYGYNYNYYPAPLTVSCTSYPQTVNTGDVVNWTATVYGGNGSYTYSWSGTEGPGGNYGSNVTQRYYNVGPKTANVTVTSSNGQSIIQNCGTVNVVNGNYNYYNPYPVYTTPVYPINVGNQIACSAGVASATVGDAVSWTVESAGAYYSNTTYAWTGTDGLSSTQPTATMVYTTPGTKSAIVTVTTNGQSRSQACVNTVTVKAKPAPAPRIVYVKASNTQAPAQVTDNTNGLSAASIFSLQNVPWGWVFVLVMLVLFGIIFYLLFNRKNM